VLETRHCDAIVLVGDFRGERRLVEDLGSAHIRVSACGTARSAALARSRRSSSTARAGIHAALKHLTSLGTGGSRSSGHALPLR